MVHKRYLIISVLLSIFFTNSLNASVINISNNHEDSVAQPHATVGIQLTLREMKDYLSYLESHDANHSSELEEHQPGFTERAEQWQILNKGKVPKKQYLPATDASPDKMELPLTTLWDQDSPYNDQCPNLTPGLDEHTETGCLATALSQIMNYWRWPKSGVGSDSVVYYWRSRTNWDAAPLANNPHIPDGWDGRLVWTSASGGQLRMSGNWDRSVYQAAYSIDDSLSYRVALITLWNRMSSGSKLVSVNFGASTYHWSILQDDHRDTVDTGDLEVAKIMLHVGVALDTSFGFFGSGSDLWRAILAPEVPIVNYFRYDPDLRYKSPVNPDAVVTEIQWLRPVPMSGIDADGAGHAWVIYGYNKKTSPWEFKMKMGWTERGDGWYSLDNMPGGINYNHNCLIRMAPQGIVRFVGGKALGDGSPDAPYQNIEQALALAPDGTTLIFKAGSVNTFSAPILTINRPLTLKGVGITIKRP